MPSFKAIHVCLSALSACFLLQSCQKSFRDNDEFSNIENATFNRTQAISTQPNIIMLLADDIGYEIPTYSGGESYQTPNLDSLARKGMQFTHCFATPDCCPSRVELLTGKYGVRNYIDWSVFDPTQKTFVNYLKDAGYATCVAGKWQLGNANVLANQMGFDTYLLFDPFKEEDDSQEGRGRYKNPVLYKNGAYLPSSETQGKYADDMFVDFISHFIDSNKNKPFFVYYPLSLCHVPFSPTPDDPQFASWDPLTGTSNTKYFPSMVKYMDKKIGVLVNKIKSQGLSQNTIIVFSGDNGSVSTIFSKFQGRTIQGGKFTPTDYGVHVPLVVSCPSRFAPGTVQSAIVDYSDFFTSFTDMANISSANAFHSGLTGQ